VRADDASPASSRRCCGHKKGNEWGWVAHHMATLKRRDGWRRWSGGGDRAWAALWARRQAISGARLSLAGKEEAPGAGSSCGRIGRREEVEETFTGDEELGWPSMARRPEFSIVVARARGWRGARARLSAKGQLQELWVGFYRARRGRGGDGRDIGHQWL
jgi:hypothetical protein